MPVGLSSVVALGVLALLGLAAFILEGGAMHNPSGFVGSLLGSKTVNSPDGAWNFVTTVHALRLLAISLFAGFAPAFVLQLLAYKTEAAARLRASRPSRAAAIVLTLLAVLVAWQAIGAYVAADHSIGFLYFFQSASNYQLPSGAFGMQYASVALLSAVVVGWVMLVVARVLRRLPARRATTQGGSIGSAGRTVWYFVRFILIGIAAFVVLASASGALKAYWNVNSFLEWSLAALVYLGPLAVAIWAHQALVHRARGKSSLPWSESVSRTEAQDAELARRASRQMKDDLDDTDGAQQAYPGRQLDAFCPSCGTPVDPASDAFCPGCGRAQLQTS